MLLSLNEDCLRIILKKLNFKDQISCVFVCQRLQIILTEIWQSKIQAWINRRPFKQIPMKYARIYKFSDISLEYFIEYVRCVSDSVEDLWLEEIDLNDFKNIQFPKVHSLEYTHFGNHPIDSEKLIKNLFPNLTKLKLDGELTGSHLHELTNLETLEFEACDSLQPRYFENLYSKLKKIKQMSFLGSKHYKASADLLKKIVLCETVEEISIDEKHFLMVSEELFKLENLKKITIFCKDYWVENICEHITDNVGGVVHTIEITNVYINSNSIEKLVALRKLILHCFFGGYIELRGIAASVSQTLEELDYRDKYGLDSENCDWLLEIVRRCTKLKTLDLTYTDADLNFVKKLAAIIASDNKKRNQVLVVNCSRTEVHFEDLKTLSLPEKLKISFEYKQLEVVIGNPQFIRCEWNTADKNY